MVLCCCWAKHGTEFLKIRPVSKLYAKTGSYVTGVKIDNLNLTGS